VHDFRTKAKSGVAYNLGVILQDRWQVWRCGIGLVGIV
jgi:hypothetical protein